MEKLIKEYEKKYGYNPYIQYFKYLGESEFLKHFENANGREIIIIDKEDSDGNFTVEYK